MGKKSVSIYFDTKVLAELDRLYPGNRSYGVNKILDRSFKRRRRRK